MKSCNDWLDLVIDKQAWYGGYKDSEAVVVLTYLVKSIALGVIYCHRRGDSDSSPNCTIIW